MSASALLIGFKPLPGKLSPSMMVVNELEGTRLGKLEVVGIELTEDFKVIPGVVERVLQAEQPSVAVSLGWDTPPWIKVEKIAINIMSAHVDDKIIPDHEGYAPAGVQVVEDGPLAYSSTFPSDEIVQRIRDAGIPAFESYAPGTHVRNATLYSLLHWTHEMMLPTLAGQIHLPPMPGMFSSDQVTMELTREVEAVKLAVQVCAGAVESGR